MRVAASAPGKLVLLGEYAVLDGAPALVLAVNRRATATLTPIPGARWEIVSPTLGLTARLRFAGDAAEWDDTTPPAGLAWIATLLARFPRDKQLPSCRMELASDAFYLDHAGTKERLEKFPTPVIPAKAGLRRQDAEANIGEADGPKGGLQERPVIHSDFRKNGLDPGLRRDDEQNADRPRSSRIKLGLGSSAALTVALLGALHALANRPPPTLAEAIATHRAIQHGRGSGIDIAASLTGGLTRFQLDADTAHTAPTELPHGLHMVCVYSGRPASTSAMLAEVATWRTHAPDAYARHLRELATISSRGVDAVAADDAATFLSSLHAYAQALARFGHAAGVDIASREHLAIGAIATDCGCVYKSCGAGGGDVGVTFAVDNERLQAFATRGAHAGFRVIELEPDRQGLEIVANV
jgi:mevalonate kinase